MNSNYEAMLEQAIRNMDEEATLDLMACFYKAFSNKVDADAYAWSVRGMTCVFRNSFGVWLIPLSDDCENAFRAIGLEYHSTDVDPDGDPDGESFTARLEDYYNLVV